MSLLWSTQNFDKDLIIKLNNDARNNNYTPEFWKKNTGKNIEELWQNYVTNSLLK
ncbi:basic secretory protein-like protein [Halpernia sp. GG3]